MNQNTFNKASVQLVPSILLTIDIEDWFQVENFKQYIPFSSWPSYELRVEKNTHTILDFLDEFSSNPNLSAKTANSIKATFFILGWIAERLPGLVKEIHARGHEIASHGYNHELKKTQSYEDIRRDLIISRTILEDIIGENVFGYRAPSFSISNDMIKIIEECGYRYDSSFNSFAMHSRYGRIDLSQYAKIGIAAKLSDDFYELPISNLTYNNTVIPWGGGAYFRLIPYLVFRMGLARIIEKEGCYVFYLHPWEIDPNQPRVNGVKVSSRLRHYSNLKRTSSKLKRLIGDFSQSTFMTCTEYINSVG